MRREQLNRRTHQTSAAATAERPPVPQILQRGKAVRLGGGIEVRIFKITGYAVGDYVYNCEERLIDSSEWSDTDNDDKFVDKGDADVEVYCISEAGNSDEHSLSVNDVLIGWHVVDDEGVERIIGMSPKYAWWKA